LLIAISNFYKIWLGGGSPRCAPSRQILPLCIYKCGLVARKIAKIGKGYIPFINFFTKFGVGEGLPSPHNHANFHLRGLKNVALWPPKWQKIAIFGINLPLRKNPGGP